MKYFKLNFWSSSLGKTTTNNYSVLIRSVIYCMFVFWTHNVYNVIKQNIKYISEAIYSSYTNVNLIDWLMNVMDMWLCPLNIYIYYYIHTFIYNINNIVYNDSIVLYRCCFQDLVSRKSYTYLNWINSNNKAE